MTDNHHLDQLGSDPHAGPSQKPESADCERQEVEGAVKRRCLIVADRHLGMLGGIHDLLRSLFDIVVMVADERSLSEAVLTLDPVLVMVDLSLARGGEADIVGRLLQSDAGLRVVVLSVHDEPEIADWLVSAGAVGFVLKRTAATDLIPAVRTALEGGIYVSPCVRQTRNAS